MKIPLFYIPLLTVSCSFCSLIHTAPVHAKTAQPTIHVGTWQNKDEDGDGVPDEQDDYPFDADLSTSAYFQESELNWK